MALISGIWASGKMKNLSSVLSKRPSPEKVENWRLVLPSSVNFQENGISALGSGQMPQLQIKRIIQSWFCLVVRTSEKVKYPGSVLRKIQTSKPPPVDPMFIRVYGWSFRHFARSLDGFAQECKLLAKRIIQSQFWSIVRTSEGLKNPALVLLGSVNFRGNGKLGFSSGNFSNFSQNEISGLSFRFSANFRNCSKWRQQWL